jgi:hypothetical protein
MAGQPEQTIPAKDSADGMSSVVVGGEGQDDPGVPG